MSGLTQDYIDLYNKSRKLYEAVSELLVSDSRDDRVAVLEALKALQPLLGTEEIEEV